MGAVASLLDSAVNDAIDSGDINQMKAVAPSASGSPVAPKLNNAISYAANAIAPVQTVVDATNKSGGVSSAQGRLTAADSIKSFSGQQTPTNFIKGIADSLMGIPGAWKELATGPETATTQIGADGGSVTAWMPANGGRPTKVLNNATQQYMTADQYESGGYGKYANMESTPGYKQNIIAVEKASKEYWIDVEAANRGSAVLENIDQNNQRIILPNATALAKTGLSSQDLNYLVKKGTAVTSLKSSLSNGLQSMASSSDSTVYNNAIDQANANGVSVSLPKIIGVDSNHKFQGSDGKSYSINDLNQKMNTFNSSSGTEQMLSQNHDNIVKDLVYSKMGFNQQVMFQNMLNAIESNERLKTNNAEFLSKIPVINSTIPFQEGQELPVLAANTMVDNANSKASALYRDKLLQASANGAIPQPGAIVASMTIGENKKALDAIRSKAAQGIDDIQSSSQEPVSSPISNPPVATINTTAPSAPPAKSSNPARPAIAKEDAALLSRPSLDDLLKKHTH